MEYIPNSAILRSVNKLNKSRLVSGQLTDGVLSEMKRLHRAGIAHNDLHPGNILVSPNNKITLIDFGLASSIKHSDRHEAMASIHDELQKVVTRVVNINKQPAISGEIKAWVDVRHISFLQGLNNGTLSNKELSSGIDAWYKDLRKAVQFKVSRPNSVLRLNTII